MVISVMHTTETKDIQALTVTLTNGSQFHITEDYGGALVVSAPVPMVVEQVNKERLILKIKEGWDNGEK